MKMNLWWLLGATESSPESRKKLGVVALLYFIQGAPAIGSSSGRKPRLTFWLFR
jgi:hypothetical protein